MSTSSDHVQSLINVTRKEEKDYGKYDEVDPPLEKRIRQYCHDLGFDELRDVRNYAWSATFVSWCLFTAGATSKEFKFHPRHAVFIQWAIKNYDEGKGLFRGYGLEAYAPQLGDLIANNRDGGKVTYEEARKRENYQSHSAIVVDFEEEAGVRYAVTIGGNEGNTISSKRVALTKDGKIKQRRENPYICVIENRKQKLAAPAVERLAELRFMPSAEAAPKTLSAAFRKHGTFIYEADDTIKDYGSIKNVVDAMKRAEMSHAWVRIHGQRPYSKEQKQAIKNLVEGLQDGGVAVAGWGWCQGVDAKGDAQLALQELESLGLEDYLADIENRHNNSHWDEDEIRTFCSTVRVGIKGSFGITTFPLIDWHEPELMRAALPFVDAFALQGYWFNFPNRKMVKEFRRRGGPQYELDNPAEYAELCLDRWKVLLGGTSKALILTGQAYWGEGEMPQGVAEKKLEQFLATWENFERVVGLNWWHFGGREGMSHRMLETIVAAELGKGSYMSV